MSADTEQCEIWTNAILEEFSKNLQELSELLEKCNVGILNIKNKFGYKYDDDTCEYNTSTEYDNVLNSIENDIHNGMLDPQKTSIGDLLISLIQKDDEISKRC